jgi:aubergine-like protein
MTNYYKFNFTNPERRNVFKYNVKFTPDLPDNSKKPRNKLVNTVRQELSENFLGFFIFLGASCIYSLENVQEIPTMKATLDDVEYEIAISWVQCIAEQDNDMLVFLKVFFNSLLKKIRFKQIGRNFFNPSQSTAIPAHNIEIWPGFSSSLQMLEKGVLLNVDIVHKVLRTDNVLDFIYDLKNRCRGDIASEIKKALIGVTILTSYNKRTYKVDDIDFDKSPKDSFALDADGTETTYQQYYKDKYQAEVTDMNQPVLITENQKTGSKIVLIPELCQMTGLTDSMRANFQLMKEMSHTTHADARKRVQECKSLLEMFA